MATLYVTEAGALIEKEYKRILVTKEDVVLRRVPLVRISEIVLIGRVGVTTPAMHTLLRQGIGLTFLDWQGRLIGRLAPALNKNIILRHLQYERAQDPQFCLRVSRQIVLAKLRNQRTLARRVARGKKIPDESSFEQMQRAINGAETADDIPELMGHEGSGARAYFRLLAQAIPAEWGFTKRVRRPPKDPVNAMLSLGYVLLGQAVVSALEVVALDPYDGFFHSDRYGRPALALDLVEEFRSVIADSVALTIVGKKMLTPDDFRPGPKGARYLKRPALKEFLQEFSDRMETRVQHPTAGRELTYQQCLEVQARLLRKTIENPEQEYQPFRTR